MATTVARYVVVAALFFNGVGAAGDELDLSGLNTVTVTRFVLRQSQRLGVGSAKNMVTGLRSLLRFLHLEGVAAPLAAAVPGVAGWGVASLPRVLEPEQVSALLASCDLSSTVGRRDHAMITLLARLGLRGGEVAALELDDFDWRQGQVLIRGKGGRLDALPLPVDVGEAVSSYIKSARVQVQSRRLFLRVRAPLDVELTANSVKEAVKQACRRAGLPPIGPHRLRHTAATELLRAGASLTEVGQVLRHRGIRTTAIYTKVDRTALRELARPWPGATV